LPLPWANLSVADRRNLCKPSPRERAGESACSRVAVSRFRLRIRWAVTAAQPAATRPGVGAGRPPIAVIARASKEKAAAGISLLATGSGPEHASGPNRSPMRAARAITTRVGAEILFATVPVAMNGSIW